MPLCLCVRQIITTAQPTESPDYARRHANRLTPVRISFLAQNMRFFSDNAAPVHPKVMQAIADANQIDTAYDGDRWSAQLDARFSETFGCDVAVLWVAMLRVAMLRAFGVVVLGRRRRAAARPQRGRQR